MVTENEPVTGQAANEQRADTIVSRDGTRIAYTRSGQGPPLVLVHGTGADRTRWTPVLPAFEKDFTVYCVDRRGRGGSGDAAEYALEQEFEDIAAVIDGIGEPVNLLGHSFGGLCALEAALLSDGIRKLMVYEGTPIPGFELWRREAVARIQELVDEGSREEALIFFFRELVHLPASEVEMLRGLPSWQGRVDAVHTIPRELDAFNRYAFDPEKFRNLEVPTAFLVGGDNPPFMKAAAEVVQAVLPNSQIVVLPGQRHIAMNTAPELFVREVVQFLQA